MFRPAIALVCALAAPSIADPTPALAAGTSMMVLEEAALGSRVSLGAAFAGEVALPIRGTRWSLVPAVTLGLRVGTQPVVGTLAETFSLARPVGPVAIRAGVGPMQMLVEDSGRAQFVDRGFAVCAAVQYRARRDLAVMLSANQGWLGQASILSGTLSAAWTP